MNISSFVWNKARVINRLPGMYLAYKTLMRVMYRDNSTVIIRRGPAAGYKWRNYSCYQPWMSIGIYEPEVSKLIFDTLQPGDVFYDVGANAGYYTLIGARAVGVSGKVIAFDPVPKNAATIDEQIKLNELQRICKIEEVALSNKKEVLGLSIPTQNANAHLTNIVAPHIKDQSGEIIQVNCIRLDDYAKHNAWPTFVKIDIEGAEVQALIGAKGLLENEEAPVLLITAHSSQLEKEVKDILLQAGYKITDFPHMIHALPPRMHMV